MTRSFRAGLCAVACGTLLAVPAAARAQATAPAPTRPTTATPADPPQDLQQVRDEIARLERDFQALRQQYEQRLGDLERRLAAIGAGPSVPAAAPPPPAAAPPPPAATPPEGTGAESSPAAPQAMPAGQVVSSNSKVFNPDASVIGNFLGHAGKNESSGAASLELTEAEVAFQAVVDPYARADFFLSAGPEGLDIEEGYATFTTLPANLLLKVGKMRAQFGKINTLHTHTLPTADRPLVTDNLVGGEDGIDDAGMSLSHLINNPYLFIEATGEVYHGSSDVFQSHARSKLAYVGRFRAYRDLTESSNIDLGTSLAYGPADVAVPTGEGGPAVVDGDPAVALDQTKNLFGIDATFRYRPLRRAIYRRLNLRTELIWSRQDLPAGGPVAKAFGFYGLGEYQFAQRWYLGARVDRSGRVLNGDLHDTGGSVFLTYWPTEFSQIRGQYRRTNYAEGIHANEFLFQFNFSIGAHGAHVF